MIWDYKDKQLKAGMIFAFVMIALGYFTISMGVPRQWVASFFIGGGFFHLCLEIIRENYREDLK